MCLVAALFSIYTIVKLVEGFEKVMWLVFVYYVFYWLFLLLLVVWGQNGTPGWPTLRGDYGKIFVNLKGKSKAINGCIMLFVDSVQPEG